MGTRYHRLRGFLTFMLSLLMGIGLTLGACGGSSSSSIHPMPDPVVVTTVITTMSGAEVVPPVAVSSIATATATLTGANLMVTGEFTNLEGPLRDFTTDPVDNSDLNARLTSAVHIHMGATGENGPFQFPLTVTSADNRSGIFMGSLALSEAQVEAFMNDKLYYDIHTAAHRPGELRGQILP